MRNILFATAALLLILAGYGNGGDTPVWRMRTPGQGGEPNARPAMLLGPSQPPAPFSQPRIRLCSADGEPVAMEIQLPCGRAPARIRT
jgi:hypothetical protein